MLRLAEAISDNWWDWRETCNGRAYIDCHFCCGSGADISQVEHDSECPVLLAKEVLYAD